MPTYVYEYLSADGEGLGETFEHVQAMRDDPLTVHPENGRPVRRIPARAAIAGRWSDAKAKSQLSNKNLERLGFTKYERRGKGYMERVAGDKGPKSISAEE